MGYSRSWVFCPFVAKNMDGCIINSNIHPHNTRSNTNLHLSSARLTKYQKGSHFSGIKVYNCLHATIKQLSGDVNKFKLALKISFSWILLFHRRIFRMDYPKWPKCFVLVMIVELAGLSTLSYLSYLSYYFILFIYCIHYL
jgi:hypothetical protein